MTKKINVKGDIIQNSDKWIYDWLDIEATSPQDINEALVDANGQDIEVDINSGGGDIFAGSEIYTAIRNYKGDKTIKIVGIAASAASVIAMAGKNEITPTGLFMMHNVHGGFSGDYRDVAHGAEVLKTANQAIANAYKEKTGLSDEELFKLMDKETWLSAEDAVKYKFVDGVMFSESKQPSFYNSTGGISPEAIAKIKSQIKKPDIENNDNEVFLLQAKLNLLKLKGDVEYE